MSLFKAKDLWSTTCGDDDLFDFGCLKVANINANEQNNDFIITGSYNGYLRIYSPSPIKDSTGKIDNAFKAHDLILEKAFNMPILQIEAGRFVNTSSKLHLAILFPRKLGIFEVLGVHGNVDHGNQFSLKFIYEHVLQRTSFNMCKGPFGGVNQMSEPHEYICVQSMDGILSIYEYESYSLSCYLPNALIPGPLKYFPKTDSFITVSSSWQLESYRYQVLATNGESFDRKAESQKGKKIQADWIYNLGEAALDIDIINNGNNWSIIVLGERNLFCLAENFTLKFMKKFDYNPSCFLAYRVKDNLINFMVATHSKALFVHEDVKVKWAAQLDHVPVQVAIARLQDLRGVVVSISEDGKLHCSYLGTEAAFANAISIPDEKALDFSKAESEYRVLQTKIKEAIMNTGAIMPNVNETNKSGLLINVEVPTKLDSISRVREIEVQDVDAIPSLTIKIQLRSSEMIQNVKMSIVCQLPIVSVPENACYSSVGGVPLEQDVIFYLKTRHIPSSLNVTIVATYTHANNATRVAEKKFRLPFKLIAKAANQQQQKKQVPYKVIFDTSKPCVNVNEIFPEFSEGGNANQISMQYYGGCSTSIQASKTSNRYRLQSESFESLWLVTQEFFTRLNAHFKNQKDFLIAYQDNLPIEEYKQIIDKHLQLRQFSDRYKEMLEQCCVQFRAIQKRLLNKFKDKTPTSLDNLDAILEATYRQITTLADRHDTNQRELSLVAQSLGCATNLYVLLIALSANLTQEEVDVLESVMTPQFNDTPDLGWEEVVNASITNLLRTTLSKTSKDQITSQQQLKMPTDVLKLEKHIKAMCERLEKGNTLVTGANRKTVPIFNSGAFDSRSQSSLSQVSSTDDLDKSKGMPPLSKPKVKEAPVGELPTYDDILSSRSTKSSRQFQDDLDNVLSSLDKN